MVARGWCSVSVDELGAGERVGRGIRRLVDREWVPVAASGVVLVAAWTLLAGTVPSYIFPTPRELVDALAVVATGQGEYSPGVNYGFTLARVFLGAALSVGVGVAGGILMGVSQRAKAYLYVYALMTFAFPSVIWAFLAVLWFGLTTFLVPLFAVFMIVAPYVMIIVDEGMGDLDEDLVEMGDSFDAESALLWRSVYVPHLYPHIFASVRLALTLSWKITIVAEIFGTDNGVGQVINFFFQSQRSDMILAWALPMMVFMYGVERLLRRVEDRAFAWREDVEDVVRA